MYDMGMMEGPSIEGKWYNKRTGKTITVKDMMMSDEGMQIFTTDNQLIDGDEFSRDYIQCDDTVYDNNGNATGTIDKVDYNSMFADIGADESTFNDTSIYNDNSTAVVNKKFDTLDSLFSKLDKLPEDMLNVINFENLLVTSKPVTRKSYTDDTMDSISRQSIVVMMDL